MLANVVVIRQAREALDDEPEDDVAGVGVALAGAGLEFERLVDEEREVVGELANRRRRRGEIFRAEEVAQSRLVLNELLDRDLVGDRRGVIGKMLADRVGERELPRRGSTSTSTPRISAASM